MKILCFILLACVLQCGALFSQKSLQITIERLGGVKIYEVHISELFEYKVKGDHAFNKKVIANLTDSLIYFDDASVVTLAELKTIRFRKRNHLVSTFQAVFFGFGIGFLPLSILNNLITNNQPVVNPTALYVAGSVIAAGFIMRQINIKHIHLSKTKTVRTVEHNYDNLNKKEETPTGTEKSTE